MKNLLSFQYDWFSDKNSFCDKHGELLKSLVGKTLNSVYAVYDMAYNEWFFDAPMIIDAEGIFVYVNVMNLCETAIGLDEFSPKDKPVWFEEPYPEGWTEELEWHIFQPVNKCFGQRIVSVEPVTPEIYKQLFGIEERGLNGLRVNLEHGALILHDNGDEIFAQFFETKN